MSDDRLAEGLLLLGIGEPDRAAMLLRRHLAELERWNPRFGLVKAAGDELVVKHCLDSIAAAPVIGRLAAGGSAGAGVLDVGSGAGFPGIPLAVALPEVSFTLLERSANRAAFLENCRALLALANVRVLSAELSTAHGCYGVVTFRAVAPLPRMLADLRRSRVAWQYLAAFKGRRERIEEELAVLERAGSGRGPRVETVRLEVPFLDEERHLVVLGNPAPGGQPEGARA